MPEEKDGFEGYEQMSPEGRLRVLVGFWERAEDAEKKAFFEGRMIEASIGMPEHPDWFDNACLCDECASC